MNKSKLNTLLIRPGYRNSDLNFLLDTCESLNVSQIIFIRKSREPIPSVLFSLADIIELELTGIRLSRQYNSEALSFRSILSMFYKFALTLKLNEFNLVLTSTEAPLHSKLIFLLCKLNKIRICFFTEAWSVNNKISLLRKLYLNVGHKMLVHSFHVFPRGKLQYDHCLNIGVTKSKLTSINGYLPEVVDGINLSSKPKDCVKFLYVGNLERIKGCLTLLKAFTLSSKLIKNINLTVVGKGKLERSMKNFTKKHNVKGITFTNFIHHSKIGEFFNNADVLVCPSLNINNQGEGWGNVVNEALSYNLAIIVSDSVGAKSDLVFENLNGHIFETDNHIRLAKIFCDYGLEKISLEDYKKNSRIIYHDFVLRNNVKINLANVSKKYL